MYKEEKQESRLAEMLAVLRKNDIAHGITPNKLRTILEELGPTFIKLGQILSMRPDLIPQAYCEELTQLRSQVTPLDYTEVRKLIREEYGVKHIHEVFLSFDHEPLGSASIAQVHHAVLINGKEVVVRTNGLGLKR